MEFEKFFIEISGNCFNAGNPEYEVAVENLGVDIASSHDYRRFHGDVICRVTWASGTTGWQKIFGRRVPRAFLIGFMPCLH